MKKKVISTIVIAAAFLFILPQHASAQVSAETSRLLRSAKIQVLNKPADAAEFTLPLLSEENAALSSHKGSVVILNFWATWCPPCRAEMPSMETFYQRYKDRGLEMLAVNLGETAAAVRPFIQKGGYTFPVMLDLERKIGGLYGIEAIPTTYIINREGKMIGRVVGSIHWDTQQIFAAFDALLKE